MWNYPNINPVALDLGFIQVHWYGLMYLIGFLSFWILGVHRAKKQKWSAVRADQISDIIFYGAMGVIIGGRLGYVVFYNLSSYLSHPLGIFAIWDGGMSFHGGIIGVIIALFFYCRHHKINLPDLLDFCVPLGAIGIGAGRIGNFINGELWGKVTTSQWGMVFPTGGDLPRYPTQLLEFFLEGFVLFVILWLISIKRRQRFTMIGWFSLLYGLFRIFIEFFREPDAQLGYLLDGTVTMGQILSIPMVLLGAGLLIYNTMKIKKVYAKVAEILKENKDK